MLGFVAFHIKSRARLPQKIKEKWKDTQLFPGGPLAFPTGREGGWASKGERDTKPVGPGMGDAPARPSPGPWEGQQWTAAGFDCQTAIGQRRPSVGTPNPQGSLDLAAQWLRGAVVIGQSEHHRTGGGGRVPRTVRCGGMAVIERAGISQSVFAHHHGHGAAGGRDLISHPSPGRPRKPKEPAFHPNLGHRLPLVHHHLSCSPHMRGPIPDQATSST